MKFVTIVTILAIVTGITDAVPGAQHAGRGHDLMRRKYKRNKDNSDKGSSNKGNKNSDGGDLKPI
jgi:hypothetical protein